MTRPTTDDLPRVDLAELVRRGRLAGRGGLRLLRTIRRPSAGGWSDTSRWRGLRGDVEMWSLTAEVRLADHRGELVLTCYAQRLAPVTLEAEPLRLGGARWWARCPSCSRRCRWVYVRGARAACRTCCGLAYASQRQPDDARARHQLYALAERLGGDHDDVTEWCAPPPRPRRMRVATYARHLRRWAELAERDRAGWVRAAARWGVLTPRA